MNSTGNLLNEIANINTSQFSRVRVYFDGKAGSGTAWEYTNGENPFEVEITPEQALVLCRLQEKFSLEGCLTGEADPDEYEKAVLETLPDILINRYPNRIEVSGNAQWALYDFIK
ncbi:MAG: hypothetical protein RL557_262 [archaeon]|jgi:hypothetical protein